MKYIIFFLILFFFASVLLVYSNKAPENVKREKFDGIVTNIWLHEESRLDRLRENDIRLLTVDIGGIGFNGRILTPDTEIRQFLKFISDYEKKTGYEFIVLPYSEVNTDKYNLNDEFLNNFVQSHNELIKMGFDGVYVDIEPVPREKQAKYLSLLKKINSTIPDGKYLAVYSGAVGDSNKNQWEWDLRFFKEVSKIADIIVIPIYDSYITSETEYEKYVKMQIFQISINSWGNNSLFMIAIPSHKQAPETIDKSYNIFISETKKYSKTPFVGVNIFSEWTMSEEEWRQFEKLNPKLNIIYLTP